MVLLKNWKFFHLFILGKKGQENVFHDILERKNAFIDYKNKNLKRSRNWDFSKKGLVYGFGQKLSTFPSLYFRQNRPAKCLSRYSSEEKPLRKMSDFATCQDDVLILSKRRFFIEIITKLYF